MGDIIRMGTPVLRVLALRAPFLSSCAPVSGPSTTISYQISFRNHVHNSMAEYPVEAQTTVSMMCDRSASTPRTELIAVSKAKGVDAHGIPPRGAPD